VPQTSAFQLRLKGKKMIHIPNTIAFLALTAAPVVVVPEADLTLCEAHEQTVFYGQVADDFGLDVAVCTSGDKADQTLTIRWEGEGGGSSVSCAQGDCDGRIEYSRYTSHHLTILTLAWRDGEHTQLLTQTVGRGDVDEPAKGSTSHSWQTPGTEREDALEFPVNTNARELSLMALESALDAKPWHRPLLEVQP
jgi:hypothetical protein